MVHVAKADAAHDGYGAGLARGFQELLAPARPDQDAVEAFVSPVGPPPGQTSEAAMSAASPIASAQILHRGWIIHLASSSQSS